MAISTGTVLQRSSAGASQVRHPEKVLFGTCFTWVYRDTAGTSVGFGAVELCKEYEQFTGGRRHTYIPVIDVHPEFQGRGYGKAIVEHLVTEAVLFFHSPLNCLTGDTQEGFSDLLFLDVYSARADIEFS